MTKFALTALILILTSHISSAADTAPRSEEQKTLYAVGLTVARQLSVFTLSAEELEIVKQGLMDAATGRKTEIELSAYTDKIQELARARRKAKGEKLAAGYKNFLEQAAKEKGAEKSASGLIYQTLTEGTGPAPGPKDTVKVNYRGTFPDGKEFDSSSKHGKAIEFKLDSVIKCWTEGVQKMKTGGKAKLICPAEIAYGETGYNDLILPGATLVFEIELLEIKK